MNKPTYSINLEEHGSILAVQFSPYEWSQDVILIAFRNKLVVAQVVFSESINFTKLGEFSLKNVCTALCLSPETSINSLIRNLQFCTAGNDEYVLRVYKSNLDEETNYIELKGHNNYINDLSYNVENSYIASTSDDKTAKIWNISDDYNCEATFNLQSPGVSVCWHRENTSRLLVAERNGLIRFYDILLRRPIISLDISNKCLSAAHWAPSDSQLVVSVNMGELFLWDITKPSTPKQSLVFTNDCTKMRISPLGELVATVNRLEGSLKIIHLQTLQHKLSTKIMLPSNVSWHYRLPIICVGDDKKLCFWNMSK